MCYWFLHVLSLDSYCKMSSERTVFKSQILHSYVAKSQIRLDMRHKLRIINLLHVSLHHIIAAADFKHTNISATTTGMHYVQCPPHVLQATHAHTHKVRKEITPCAQVDATNHLMHIHLLELSWHSPHAQLPQRDEHVDTPIASPVGASCMNRLCSVVNMCVGYVNALICVCAHRPAGEWVQITV